MERRRVNAESIMAEKNTDEDVEGGKGRLEAFCDGVFAIAITLLILEIKLPHAEVGHESGINLARELWLLWPYYFAYVLSFITIGIFWANHHSLLRLYRKTDHWNNILTILLLMGISFLPLPTEALGEYLLDPTNRRTAVIFYAFGLFIPVFFWGVGWLYASMNHRLLDHRLDSDYVNSMTKQYILSNGLYLFAFAVAFVNSWLSLTITVGLTMLYLQAPRKPVYKSK